MGRPRMAGKRTVINVGANLDIRLATAFHYLCKKAGVKSTEGIRRVIIDVVKKDRIPGIDPLEVNYDELNAQMPFAHTRDSSSTDAKSQILYEPPEPGGLSK